MSPKLETLGQLTQSLQSLVADLASSDQAYVGSEQSLKEISASLAAGKLTLQIVGQDLARAEKLQTMLEIQGELADNYQFRTAIIPPVPTLILQSYPASTKLTQYKLETSHNQIIGRNPTAQLVLPNSFHLTSSNHAEFRLLNHNWQIRDAGSSNGTFINDDINKFQDWYSLKTGDRICLGSPLQAEGSASFIVDIPADSQDFFDDNITKILNCNVICLVVPPQPLPDNLQHFLKIAKTSEISKFFIAIDRPENYTSDEFTNTVNQIDSSVKYQLQGLPFGIFFLLLNDRTVSSTSTATPIRPELEQFCNSLKNIAVLGTEIILHKWTVSKLTKVIDETEDILLTNKNMANRSLPLQKIPTQDLFHADSKKSFERIHKKVTNDCDEFFEQIKIEVNQSKSNFLDEFKQNSIGQKIQEFTKQLQPQVVTTGEYRNVHLQIGPGADYNSVHEALVDLCHFEISKWATAEWERVKNEYAEGGLSSFLKGSFDKLNYIPEVFISKKDFFSSPKLNTQTILNTSSIEPDINLKYRKISFFEYLVKNGKSHAFGGVTLTLIITFLFKGTENTVKSDIEVKIFYLILFLVPFTIGMLWFNFKQDRDIRRKEATDKLKKESNDYYRSYTEWLVEKLIQRIDIIMNAEARRFQEALGNVQEAYDAYFTTQSQMKSQQDHGVEKVRTVEYLNKLHNLKKLIQSES
jgi:FHA domain